jgi:hypothetical protein
MTDSIVKKELREIENFINSFDIQTVVFRENRKIEVITEDTDAVDEKMRERFDTENVASVSIIGEGNISELYNVPRKYKHFNVIVFEIKETRSERGLDPIYSNESNNLRELNDQEIQNIDRQLKESDMNLNGLTKELYEDLQDLKVPDSNT